jgi:TPR repeat protein
MGLTAEPDRDAAAKLMRAAADKGYPPAIYQLGEFYRQGAGVPRDLMQAKAQYEKAAAQDDNEDAARKARGALAFIQQDIADEQAKSGATPQ